MIGVAGLFSGLSSNIYFPALDDVAKDLGVGIQEVNLTITSYLVIQGLSPLFWGSLSDILGRRPIYIYSFLVYITANIALSFSPNFIILLLFRGLQAAGSASTVSIGNGVIQDITAPSERGGFISFYQAIRNFSIAAGPVLGGVLANFLGFRSIFVFLLILSGITILSIIAFLPETLRSIAGDGSLRLTGIHQPLIRRFRKEPNYLEDRDPSYRRPQVTLEMFVEPLSLLKRKEILMNLLFGGVIYAIWSMVTSSTTTLFKQAFGLNEVMLGLAFIPNGVGTIIGSTVIGKLLNTSYAQVEEAYRIEHDIPSKEKLSKYSIPIDFPIEKARLKHIPWITAVFITSTMAYGFSVGSTSLTNLPGWIAVPLTFQFLIAATSNAVFAISQTLVSDLCPGKGASSTAINNLVRCSMGAVGVAVLDKMITAIGAAPTFAGLGFITIAVYPLSVVQWYWAMSWRARSADSG
ncbi:major facilitator superfamily transporter [Bimuria novae-zelandiae CBS 107.79]|uniref:Major facilitator superfamily transporter n=1 Tax=Bimuria novae-zelandiae CBS 107.79 TaxID=1447943 RepID=A0A6A5V8S0_9PLEO|nr:major facilitator superfamily transporter [Bimuria novae-zelandiae CBS 107.79]